MPMFGSRGGLRKMVPVKTGSHAGLSQARQDKPEIPQTKDGKPPFIDLRQSVQKQ